MNLSISLVFITDINDDRNQIISRVNLDKLKSANAGRILSIESETDRNCYINRYNPNLNVQPNLYIPNHYLSSANMFFDNIIAHNYTKNIETEPTQFIFNPHNDRPLYVYQKFSIEVSQYINNISIFIQDEIDPNEYTDENSWEIAIMNCTNDEYNTPNNVTLAVLQKQHPLNDAAQWSTFDFQHSDTGPIYLNKSRTVSTKENGLTKYWFAYRVKIPANDTYYIGNKKFGGAKYLYFNPDGGDPSNVGEGETFLFFPTVSYENFTKNDVSRIGEDTPANGTYLQGGLDSFKEKDDDRYIAEPLTNNLSLEFFFNIKNHSTYSYDFMRSQTDAWWNNIFNKKVRSIDIEISSKISNISNIDKATLYVYNYTGSPQPHWVPLDDFINITTDHEAIYNYRISRPIDIKHILTLMNTSDNNTLRFKFAYNGIGEFNVSINKFSITFGEHPLINLNDAILPYDPIIQELFYPKSVNAVNGTYIEQDFKTLLLNDNDYYRAQALSNNLSIEFKFQIMPDIDISIWSFVDLLEWLLEVYPFPYIPQIIFRVSSNVSIDDDYNYQLKYATLEAYNRYGYNWTDITGYNKSFAFNDERQLVAPLDQLSAYFLLQLIDPRDNSLKMRLRYISNESEPVPLEKFNVTVDEFTLEFQIQNIYSSDITSKIGFGLFSNKLKPSDIEMKNFGIPLSDNGFGNGTWNHRIANGIPNQGYFEFNVTSLWPSVSFDVIGKYEIYKLAIEIDFKDDFETQYLTGTEYFTVEVTDALGQPISGLEIIFELRDVDDKVVDEDTDSTDMDGEATGSLELDELGDGFYIKVSYEQIGIYGNAESESDEFRVVDENTILMENFLLLLPYILIGLAALFTFIALRHRRLSRLREFWAEEAMVLEDLLKISYIMIIHKDAGLTLYSKQISMELDSDLIGGFITAISQFRSEIKKPIDELSISKGFEMDYHDFKIDMVDGEYIRTALILEGIPSEQLKENQNEFTISFESKFGSLLVDFTGDIKPFRETDDLVEKFFNISLMYPLQLGSHWKFAKKNKLENALLEVAEQMQKERNHFFISSLLNYGIAGRKESKNQIISTIIGLKRRGVIVPIELS